MSNSQIVHRVEKMKTVADLKRRLTVGTKIILTYSRFPSHRYLGVERKVTAVQSNGLWIDSSFLDWPKRADFVTFADSPNDFAIVDNDETVLRYTILTEQNS